MAQSATNTPDKAKEGSTPEADPKLASSKVVAYIGSADIREIDEAGWKNADVNDQKKVVWNAKNRWQVPVDELSDAAVAYCESNADDGFVVKDVTVDK